METWGLLLICAFAMQRRINSLRYYFASVFVMNAHATTADHAYKNQAVFHVVPLTSSGGKEVWFWCFEKGCGALRKVKETGVAASCGPPSELYEKHTKSQSLSWSNRENRKRQFVHKSFVHNFVPLNPPSQPAKWWISSWICIERTSNRTASTRP